MPRLIHDTALEEPLNCERSKHGPDRYDEVCDPIFYAVLDLPDVESRCSYLNECGLNSQAQRSVGVAGNSESDLLIGQTLSHYRMVSLIGSGSMGRVYLAEDQRLGRNVALKLIAPRWKGEGRARFLREAQLAVALDHPNVRAIYDIGEDSGRCFIAIHYVDGQTLEPAKSRCT